MNHYTPRPLPDIARLTIAGLMDDVQGYTNPTLSLEDVRDNWATITDQAGYAVPNNLAEETALFFEKLR